MEQLSWQEVSIFPLDKGNSSYGFHTRLANENGWTQAFTDEAILEYKKFMYLVATNEQMLSPSPIVDKVWHLHLLFSKKYKQFCLFLGKDILHQPSTHDIEEKEIYQKATKETQRLYEIQFGKMPADIWEYNHIYEQLNWPASSYPFLSDNLYFSFFGLVFILFLPAYGLALSLYPRIENTIFFIAACSLAIVSYLLTHLWTDARLTKIFQRLDKDSFVKKLNPLELIYTQKQNLSELVAVVTNSLLDAKILSINKQDKLFLTDKKLIGDNLLQKEIIKVLKKEDKNGIFYPQLLHKILTKPAFTNTRHSINQFKTHLYQSKPFSLILAVNLLIFAFIELIFISRIATGISFDKPILFISLASILVSFLILIILYRLKNKAIFTTIYETGKAHFWDSQQKNQSIEWRYLWSGQTALASNFIPLVIFTETQNNDGSGSSSGCSSSDGSSCGGGCGGCGGGD